MTNLNIPEKISFKCLFCGSDKFKVQRARDGSIKKAEAYECSNCGEQNSYEGLLAVSKEEVIGIAKAEISKMVRGIFKK